MVSRSPFGGIPRNWKLEERRTILLSFYCSPFGGIPRNWKHPKTQHLAKAAGVPPSGGSLEIGNRAPHLGYPVFNCSVPPSGGSLEIGNVKHEDYSEQYFMVPPSGGSLEIGNAKWF